jgi:DNA-binding NtrC family response regulator
MKPARVIVIDDEPALRNTLESHLTEIGYDVLAVESATAALNRVEGFGPDLVLSDVMMPGMSGLELLSHLRRLTPDLEVVLFTGGSNVQNVIDAIQMGASDFLTKPLCLEETEEVIHRCLRRKNRLPDEAEPGPGAPPLETAHGLVGRHPKMINVYKAIGSVARAGGDTAVLIRGETGTGKELIARALHETSSRADEPFVAVNCAAVPEALLESELFGHVRGAFTGATMDRRGKFDAAAGGTLFLDEIGDTTPAFQAKLLRVLQEREFYAVGSDKPSRSATTVVAATHRHLQEMVEEGTFREDLYYRLQVLEIDVPPLRERRSDIPLLVRHLVARAASDAGMPPPAIPSGVVDALMERDWPGNVRELENVVRRAVVMSRGGALTLEDIGCSGERAGKDGVDPSGRSARSLSEIRCSVERHHVQQVIQQTGGNKSEAARMLQISRPTLNRLIRDHQLVVP